MTRCTNAHLLSHSLARPHTTPLCFPPSHLVLQEQVEPLMMQYKPPGLIKKIYFQKLTFGDDPFRCAVLLLP